MSVAAVEFAYLPQSARPRYRLSVQRQSQTASCLHGLALRQQLSVLFIDGSAVLGRPASAQARLQPPNGLHPSIASEASPETSAYVVLPRSGGGVVLTEKTDLIGHDLGRQDSWTDKNYAFTATVIRNPGDSPGVIRRRCDRATDTAARARAGGPRRNPCVGRSPLFTRSK